VVAAAGGNPFVFATSSGAALALEAAASGVPMRKLAAYEPPFMVGDPKDRPERDFEQKLIAMVQRGERDEAVKYFMRTVGVPGFVLVIMRLMPFWKDMRAVAHTLPYDAAVMNGFGLPAKRLAEVRVPVVVMAGGKTTPTLLQAAQSAAKAVPGAEHRIIPKQNHGVKPAALRPVLVETFR
jgi:pimeloyl-ACP methyl ester carboxylesterase